MYVNVSFGLQPHALIITKGYTPPGQPYLFTTDLLMGPPVLPDTNYQDGNKLAGRLYCYSSYINHRHAL